MFNRSKAKAGGRRLRATGGVPGMLEVMLLAAALFVILAPSYLSEAMAGVEPQERLNAFDSATPASAAKTGAYQLRCWQHGRLVLEENEVQLPPEIAAGMKLRGTDRAKRPVYLAETANATCLIRKH